MKGESDHVEYFDNRKANRFGYERLERVVADHDIDDADISSSKPSSNNVSLLKSLSVSMFGRTAPNAKSFTPEIETTNKNNNMFSKSISMSRSKSVSPGRHDQENQKVAKKLAKTHPLFGISFFDMRRSKKAMAKPEFLRYIEYIKEGGKV